MKTVATIVGCVAFLGPVLQLDGSDTGRTSLIAVVSDPERFHGHRVRVVGYAIFDNERNAIFPWKSDARLLDSSSGIWIDLPPAHKGRGLSAMHVLVEGTVDSKRKGHMSAFAASLRHITRLEPWDPLDDCDVLRDGAASLEARGATLTSSPELARIRGELQKHGCVAEMTCEELVKGIADRESRLSRLGDHGHAVLRHFRREHAKKCSK